MPNNKNTVSSKNTPVQAEDLCYHIVKNIWIGLAHKRAERKNCLYKERMLCPFYCYGRIPGIYKVLWGWFYRIAWVRVNCRYGGSNCRVWGSREGRWLQGICISQSIIFNSACCLLVLLLYSNELLLLYIFITASILSFMMLLY